jgi:hypothetical protein
MYVTRLQINLFQKIFSVLNQYVIYNIVVLFGVRNICEVPYADFSVLVTLSHLIPYLLVCTFLFLIMELYIEYMSTIHRM